MSIHLLTTSPDQLSPKMPGLVVSETAWIVTPEKQSAFRPHKQLPRNRNIEPVATDLRALYNAPDPVPAVERRPTKRKYIISSSVPAAELPPTPPIANIDSADHSHDESSTVETTILRSGMITPTLQQSPLTPDNTPPRHGSGNRSRPSLGTQPSMTSTRAESFTTAREDFASDDEPDLPTAGSQNGRYSMNRSRMTPDRAGVRPSPLARQADEDDAWTKQTPVNGDLDAEKTPHPNQTAKMEINQFKSDGFQEAKVASGSTESTESPELPTASADPWIENSGSTPQNATPSSSPPLRSSRFRSLQHETERPVGRGLSLRERLEAKRNDLKSPSVEQFASDIGWATHTHEAPKRDQEPVPLTEISTSSPDERFGEDNQPARQHTLRHRGKQLSLRIASSPIPTPKRDSLWSNPDSPHRSLTHKKIKLNNQNRFSFGSELSQSLSTTSSAVTPSKPEVIRVAVIPERRSSWQSSPTSSKRHSAKASSQSAGQNPLLDAGSQRDPRRNLPETSPDGGLTSRGRDRRGPPQVPARGSSLSAPTSRSNSRSNSMTSEHVRGRRLAAEADLRKTLDRMQSERAVLSLKTLHVTVPEPQAAVNGDSTHDKWAGLRPPIDTPYSLPSVQSASPGLVETGQAKAINLFPHTNNSLQLIESNPLPESRAVQTLRITGHTRRVSSEDNYPTPVTPRSETYVSSVDSPLRNPRQPPKPPRLKVVPATPAVQSPTRIVANDDQYQSATQPARTHRSLRRPSIQDRRRSESFMNSLKRNVSLNTARNRKADQELDPNGSLYPMWRPRAFWDDVERSDSDEPSIQDDGIILDNTGIPRRKTTNGPMSLMRSISTTSRRLPHIQPRALTIGSNSSQLSLAAIQAGQTKNMRGLSVMHRSLRLGSWRALPARLLSLRRRKEDEQRERRRELLRRSIGVDVVSQGDSRFPRESGHGGGARLMTTVSQDNLDCDLDRNLA